MRGSDKYCPGETFGLRTLDRLGQAVRAAAVDMFPGTAHVETVLRMERRTSQSLAQMPSLRYQLQRQERRRSHWISRCTVSLAEFPATDFRFR